MELFVVLDKAFLGRGVFGIFSNREKAEKFVTDLQEETSHTCAISSLPVIGNGGHGETVFAAHVYNHLYDTFVFDGIYAKEAFAYDAVGHKGLIIRFTVDSPGDREICG
jgi:hypothetical protein